MYCESDLLPISGLQHLIFCERQCALIHIERLWEENRLTAEGRIMHERVHDEDSETRGPIRICRGLRLRNLQLGLSGVADVVELHYVNDIVDVIVPVEYKRGKEKEDDCDRVQLCAQALCLEEMLEKKVDKGFLYYGSRKRRVEVEFAGRLRDFVRDTASRFHQLINNAATPHAHFEKRCRSCSLIDICMPHLSGGNDSASKYLDSIYKEAGDETSA